MVLLLVRQRSACRRSSLAGSDRGRVQVSRQRSGVSNDNTRGINTEPTGAGLGQARSRRRDRGEEEGCGVRG